MTKTVRKLLATFLMLAMFVAFIPILGGQTAYAEGETETTNETFGWGFPGINNLNTPWDDWDYNWMSHLPDGAKLNELSIPGAHDAAATFCGDSAIGTALEYFTVTQDNYINGLLENGIRYFDLRINKEGDDLAMCHKAVDLYGIDNERLKLDSVIYDMQRFLKHYGPNETLILQIKCDNDNCDYEIYQYFQKLMEENPDLIYCGDHVPTLGEVRGKLVILSRLELIGGAEGEHETVAEWTKRRMTPFKLDDGTYWALDVSAFNGGDESTKSMTKTSEFGSTVVWTEDMYNVPKWEKNVYVNYSLLEHGNPPENHYAERNKNEAREAGKDAWSIIYSSMSHQDAWGIAEDLLIPWTCFEKLLKEDMVWPREGANYMNPVLKEFIGSIPDMYTGCLVGDFYDQDLIRQIYSTNFLRRNADPWNSYYEVQFDSRGGSTIDAQQILYGEKAARPEDPVKEGYLFDGWYVSNTEAAGDSYAFDSTPVTEDLVLYAKWEEIPEPVPSEISYQVLKGDGSIWTKGSKSSVDFTVKRSADDNETFNRFTGILVDNKEVAASDYTAEAGSVIIKLKPEWLETLSIGSHSLTVQFDDGNASASFKIQNSSSGTSEDSPNTGDDSHPFVWFGLLCAAILVLLGLGIYRAERKRK